MYAITSPYPQIFDLDGSPLDDGKVYFGAVGTNPQIAANRIPVFWDEAGTQPAAQPIPTSNGYIYRSGTPAVVFANEAYSMAIYNKSGQLVVYARDAQTGSGFSVGIDLDALKKDLSGGPGASLIGFQQFNGTYGTVQAELRATVAMRQFPGWDPSGVGGNDGCYEKALTELLRQGGGELMVGPGAIKMSGTAGADGRLHGMFVPYTNPNGTGPRVNIKAAGRSTRLVAGSDNVTLLRYSDSHGGAEGLVFDGGGRAGVWALGVLPESVTQTTSNTYQLFNKFDNFYVLNCDEGIVMQCGPRVAGSDSGCWYNNFSNYHIFSTKRARWLRAGPNAGASGVNANRFYGGRQGQGMNTGLQIDAGSGNRFYGDDFEGIQAAGPNAVATAVKIAAADIWGSNNDSNQFFGSRLEACTRHLDNQNTRTVIFGGEWDASLFTGVRPVVMIGGDPSLMPLILPGITYAEGVPGYDQESGVLAITKDIVDVGFKWSNWVIGFPNGRVSGVTSTGVTQSKFRKQGDMVDWVFVLPFTAVSAGQEIQVAPPVVPNPTLYASTASRNPFVTLAVDDDSGVRKLVEAGWVNGTNLLYIKSPGSWNANAGNNNCIFASLRYHA